MISVALGLISKSAMYMYCGHGHIGFEEVDETSVESQMDDLSNEDLLELEKTLKMKNPQRWSLLHT
jgi:hypothetical protein